MKKRMRKLSLSKETLRSLEGRSREIEPMSCIESCYDMTCGCTVSEELTLK